MSRQLLVAPRSARPARTRSREPMCSAIVPRSPANAPRRVAGVALFLGSWTAAVDPELLARHAVRAIVDSSWGTSSAPASSPPQPRLAHSRTSSALVGGVEHRPAPPRAMSAADAGAQGHGFGGSNGGGEVPIGRFKVALAGSAALRPRLDGAVRFIRERLARGENVLVHCQQELCERALNVRRGAPARPRAPPLRQAERRLRAHPVRLEVIPLRRRRQLLSMAQQGFIGATRQSPRSTRPPARKADGDAHACAEARRDTAVLVNRILGGRV
ncbi:hypothetical protein DFH11DRAFT_1881822 [Phellopilus nigrolimitatus]|nr:hypothetical protein DFH11DRAFT_1881822 [Phellopilus nigrolimitatus]